MASNAARWASRFCLLLGLLRLCSVQLDSGFVVGRPQPEQVSRWTAVFASAVANIPSLPEVDADLGILAPLPPTASLSRYKGAAFDAEA